MLQPAIRKLPYLIIPLAIAGCTVTTDPLDRAELEAAANVDRVVLFPPGQEVKTALGLQDAVTRVLTLNLDRQLARLEEAYALGQISQDQLDQLPTIAANAGYSYRSEYYATTSSTLGSSTGAFGTPNYSSPKNNLTSDLTATWNVLDFAVGYYNARQSGNRALIAAERRRRAEMNLIRDTRTAYWRALAAQRLQGKLNDAISDAERSLKASRKSVDEGMLEPVAELRLRKTVLETIRQLKALRQELEIAEVEFALLVRANPRETITLKEADMTLPEEHDNLDTLINSAFINSPDIREQLYRVRIAADDTRKAAVDFMPSISPRLGMNYDRNHFLEDNEWYQFGLNVSWNLVRLVSAPSRVNRGRVAEKIEETRQLAVRMAVLGQTHIAWREYHNAVSQYESERELFEVESELSREETLRSEFDLQADVDLIVSRTGAIMAELRMHHAFARVMAAHAALMATTGDNRIADAAIARAQEAATDEEVKAELANAASTATQPATKPAQEAAE